jgi:hypothetical protein
LTAVTGAVGAFTLVFGLLFLLLSSSLVYQAFGYLRDTVLVMVFAELVGMTLASVGAGLLVYGVLSGNSRTSGKAPSDSPKA